MRSCLLHGQMIRQVIFFALAGVIGLLVDIAVLYALREAVGPFYGRGASFFAAVVATWLVNRSLTFRGRRSGMSRTGEFAVYFALMLVGGAVNYGTYTVLVLGSSLVSRHLFLGVVAGSLAGMVVNFLTSRFLVFRREEG